MPRRPVTHEAALVGPERILFAHLIDYAGLFPPARLAMHAAVAEYRTARRSGHSWLLGRFLCPSSRLENLAAELTATMEPGEPEFPVGVVADEAPAAAAAAVQSFEAAMAPAARVSAIEIRLPPRAPGEDAGGPVPALVAAAAATPTASIFAEVPMSVDWRSGLDDALDSITASSQALRRFIGAKLRCGGLEPAAFPSPAQVAGFIAACTQRGVAFKATAGLHHPWRHFDPELGVTQHGFVNLLAAAALAAAHSSESDLVAVIEDEDPAHFAIGPGGLTWRGHRVSTSAMRTMRSAGLTAYGSCSFAEPTADLVELGYIAEGTP